MTCAVCGEGGNWEGGERGGGVRKLFLFCCVSEFLRCMTVLVVVVGMMIIVVIDYSVGCSGDGEEDDCYWFRIVVDMLTTPTYSPPSLQPHPCPLHTQTRRPQH